MASDDMDDTLEPLERRWPRKGDRLFVSAADWENNACLNLGGPTFSLYAQGYRKGADIIVQKVKETGWDQDYLVYPVCFLYRHFLELRLKELINLGRQLFKGQTGFPENHKIDDLWVECRLFLEKAWPAGEKTDLDTVEECMKEFVSVDRSAQAFRYPQDKQGKPSLAGLSHINLRHLSEVMTRLAVLLDGSAEGMYELLQFKYEMESDYAGESYY